MSSGRPIARSHSGWSASIDAFKPFVRHKNADAFLCRHSMKQRDQHRGQQYDSTLPHVCVPEEFLTFRMNLGPGATWPETPRLVAGHVWSIEAIVVPSGWGLMKSKYVGSVGMAIGLGLCFAATFGTAMQNVAMGVAFGIAIGVAFGLALSADSSAPLARKNVTSDKPLPHPLGLFEGDHQPN